MNIGEKILNLRKKQGLSQEALGDKIKVTRQTISNWELGITFPNPKQLKILSQELNVSIDELLDNDILKENVISKSNKNIINYIGLFFFDLVVILVFVLMYGIFLVMILFSISLLFISFCIMLKNNLYNLIPYMPYVCGILCSITLISLSLLFTILSILYFRLISKLLNKFINFNYTFVGKNKKIILKESKLANEKLIFFAKIFLISFIILLLLTIIICVIYSKSLSFWHTWNWWK